MKSLILSLSLILASLNSNASYQAQIELSLKAGNQRNIGRLSVLVPILSSDTNLLYFTAIGMMDTKSSHEGNFGFGFRHLLDSSILGVYGYYDRRSTKFHSLVHQATIGAEWLKEDFELRGNVYLPKTTKKVLNTTSGIPRLIGTGTAIFTDTNTFAITQKGFDIEVGHRAPFFTPLNAFIGFYHFFEKDTKSMNGIRLRADVKISDWLSLEGEY